MENELDELCLTELFKGPESKDANIARQNALRTGNHLRVMLYEPPEKNK